MGPRNVRSESYAWLHFDDVVLRLKVFVWRADDERHGQCWCRGGPPGVFWARDGKTWVPSGNQLDQATPLTRQGTRRWETDGEGWCLDDGSLELIDRCERLVRKGRLDELGKIPEAEIYCRQSKPVAPVTVKTVRIL